MRTDNEIELLLVLAYERGRADEKKGRAGHAMVPLDSLARTPENQTAETWECERVLKIVGPKGWVEMTLSKSIAGELNCGIGKIYESRGELKPQGREE